MMMMMKMIKNMMMKMMKFNDVFDDQGNVDVDDVIVDHDDIKKMPLEPMMQIRVCLFFWSDSLMDLCLIAHAATLVSPNYIGTL
jgi:hypothetical protein